MILSKSSINEKIDGRLAPAYFSPNYKYFDQLLQTVKKETTDLTLVFKRFFLQTSIPPLISILYAKEEVSRVSVEIFLFHSAEKFCWGTLQCFRKYWVSKNFRHKRGEGVLRFSVEKILFHRTETKNFVGEPFGVSENFGYRKFLCIRRRYHYFPLKIFCLTAPKNIVGEYFNVLRKFGLSKNFMDKRGGREGVSRFSIENFLSHGAEKYRGGTLQYFRKIGISKNFMDKRGPGGSITIFRLNN